PPYVEQRFQELAIGAGEPLLLSKQSVKNGNRNRTEWSVRRAPQQPSFALANGTDAADSVVAEATPAPQVVEPRKDEEMAAGNGEANPGGFQTAALVSAGGDRQGKEEQPSANSTAPMAQQ